MASSGSAYANDKLRSGWNSSQNQGQSGRIFQIPISTQSISDLLGRNHTDVAPHEPTESLTSFASAQDSIVTPGADVYLQSLINDNEIEQIRSSNEFVLSRLLSVYVFDDETKVRSFLEDHPSTTHLLLEAVPFLRNSFGDDVILQLQIPQDEDAPPTIYTVALWEGTLDEARIALKKFDDTWWTAISHRALGRIVIDYQLV
jgi:hypothetical protein